MGWMKKPNPFAFRTQQLSADAGPSRRYESPLLSCKPAVFRPLRKQDLGFPPLRLQTSLVCTAQDNLVLRRHGVD